MKMQKGGLLLLICVFLSTFLITGIYAQEDITDISIIDEDAELEVTGGIAPDSAFYFIDKFFDNFADVVKLRQEKVAEIRAMIEDEKYDEALESLERYKIHAEEFEREVSPEQRDEARRSAAAIYNVLKSLEAQIPDEFKADFDEVIEHEKGIVTAAEIVGKIKALCEELSELDPLQYSRVCETDDNSPKWQQKLHKDLTEEQRQEAEAFFEIMSQCFETSGETCRCEDISIVPFADKCSQIAPLAYACDVENNEDACDRMDEIEEESPIEDLLPDYLRDVLRAAERRFEDDRFDNFAPRECREAGATTRIECEKIMFSLGAPPECVEALERGDINIDNGRDVRESCEKIMFQLNAPQECISKGLTDFRECGKLMFRLNAPQECLDAGLTGGHRGDERKCSEIVGGFGGPGPGFKLNCQEIQNPEDRLRCYDNALGGVEFERFQNEPERDFQEHEFPQQCQEAQAFTRESCERVMIEWGEEQRRLDEIERSQSSDTWPQQCLDAGALTLESCNEILNVLESTSKEPIVEEHVQEDTSTTDVVTTDSADATTSGITGNVFLEYYFR